MGVETKYRYNDQAERYRKMNRFNLMGATAALSIFLIFLWLKRRTGGVNEVTIIANTIVIILAFIVNAVVQLRNNSGTGLKLLIAVEIGFEFLMLAAQTDATFIDIALLGILAVEIPYYDKKFYQRLSAVYVVLFTFEVIVRYLKGITEIQIDYLCTVLIIYGMFYILIRVGNISKEFSDHALGTVAEQSGRQEVMLKDLVAISRTVKEESDRSTDMVNGLVQSTEAVARSMQEISEATSLTAENISEQSIMTQSIQESIEETRERSGQMVDIAKDSNVSIQENMKVMEELKEQSAQIAATNEQVTDSMGKLQNKTKEVEEIAGMILDISSQTNLLALNASIESARAGEAGKGFAVVADQIRQLAEQTKSSTESITRIINELNENADEVVHSVESSVGATANQNKMIHTAADSFEKLDHNMVELISDIKEIDDRISYLSDSNTKIVENISQLSATTEEVTASAEQASELSERNLEYAEQAKEAITMMKTTTESMEQYM